MRELLLALGAALLFGLASCTTDVDLNAPYKERPVIYALLDAGQGTQLVRIQKSFLTILEGNANVAAGKKDSVYYGSGTLTVALQPLNRSTGAPVGSSITLRDTVGDKDSGLFYYPDQLLYKTPPNVTLNPNSLYRLTVVNTKTGTRAEAITSVIPAMTVADLTSPGIPPQGTRLNFETVNPYVYFKYSARDSVDRFNILVEVNILDSLADGTTRQLKPLYWQYAPDSPVQPYLVYDPSGVTPIGLRIDDTQNPYRFFDLIKRNLYNGNLYGWGPADVLDSTRANANVIRRRLLPLKFTITRGDSKLSRYLDADRAYSVLTQTKPFYTNVKIGAGADLKPGIGLLATRNVAVIYPVYTNSFPITARSQLRYRSMLF